MKQFGKNVKSKYYGDIMKILATFILIPVLSFAAIGVGDSPVGNLPVELVAFNALFDNGNIALTWQTATELNNAGFEIERSFDSQNWICVGFVKGMGTTAEVSNYSFVDVPPSTYAILYYRLKQQDFDGTISYSSILTVAYESLMPEFYLFQNYPNPFNPSTVISYRLSEYCLVQLIIYDLLGNEITKLVSEYQGPGEYKVKFDALDLTSGVYIYRLNAGKNYSVKKMTIIK